MEVVLIGVLASVVGGAILAGLVWVSKWLRDTNNREGLRQKLRESVCRHDWQPRDLIGGGMVLVSQYDEQCRKCGALRSSDEL